VVAHAAGPYRWVVSRPEPTHGGTVVLIAHGSRNPRTAEDHAALCRRIADAAGVPVEPAFLELSQPSIPDAVDAAVAAGASAVRLVPFFLHVGNHVLSDLPELAAAAQQRHPGTPVMLEEHVGADPGLVDLLVARVRG
jgi:sirohydrochlorin ferrochelatase